MKLNYALGLLVIAASLVLPGAHESRAGRGEIDPPRLVAAVYVEAQGAVGLRWLPVPGAIAYKVFSSESSGGGYKLKGSVPQPQYFDTKGLEPGTMYCYIIIAVDKQSQESPDSDEKCVEVPGEKPAQKINDEAPEWVRSTYVKAQKSIQLRWKPINGAIAYNVYRKEADAKNYEMAFSCSEPEHYDTAIDPGSTYYYVIRALNAKFQEGPASEESEPVETPGERPAEKESNNVISHNAPRGDSKASAMAPLGGYFRLPGFMSMDHPGKDVATIELNGKKYLYDRGVFWSERGGRFVVVTAPVGAEVSSLPTAAEKIQMRQATVNNWQPVFPGVVYYWYGTFFGEIAGKYIVLSPPAGAVVGYIPDGYKQDTMNGNVTYIYQGICFGQALVEGTTMYQVADCKE